MKGVCVFLLRPEKNLHWFLGGQLGVHEKPSDRAWPVLLQQGLEREPMGPPSRKGERELPRDLLRMIAAVIEPERDTTFVDGDVDGADMITHRERGHPHGGGQRASLITAC